VVSHHCVLLNVCANEMNWKTSLCTEDKYGVSHQCELSIELSDSLNQQTTLYSEGRCGVYHQCELSNVSAIDENLQRF
jgi:hypothetical protein